jgi:anaerobic magnesium-protoporphyrin IX monomethyl ester cyclase
MKVCLIIPQSSFLTDEKVFVSLGILKVASALEEKGIEVEVLDLSGVKDYEIPKADVYGITATTPQLPAAVAIARSLTGKTILGGPHVTLINSARKRIGGRSLKAFNDLQSEFDVLVAGDGERAIFEAIEGEGLIDADDCNSPLFVDKLEGWPARHLIDMGSYHYEIDGVNATSLIAQLGCPFKCGFCGGRNTDAFGRMRIRHPISVIAEIIHLNQTYGYRGFMFYDDELNVNPNLIDLLGRIEKLKLDLRLRGFVRADLFNDEQAEAMYKAGFRIILAGFESGSPKMLKNMNKKTTVEQNSRCIKIAHKHGLKVKALMSVGHPGESEETIKETREWLRENKPDEFDITIIAVYPGTNYYDRAVPDKDGWKYTINGDNLYSDEIDCRYVNNYYKGSPEEYVSFVHTDYLSAKDLVRLRREIEYDKI